MRGRIPAVWGRDRRGSWGNPQFHRLGFSSGSSLLAANLLVLLLQARLRCFVEFRGGACSPPHIDVIEGPEGFAARPGFGQDVDNTIGPGEKRLHDIIVELRRNIDAAIGNAVVERG